MTDDRGGTAVTARDALERARRIEAQQVAVALGKLERGGAPSATQREIVEMLASRITDRLAVAQLLVDRQ